MGIKWPEKTSPKKRHMNRDLADISKAAVGKLWTVTKFD